MPRVCKSLRSEQLNGWRWLRSTWWGKSLKRPPHWKSLKHLVPVSNRVNTNSVMFPVSLSLSLLFHLQLWNLWHMCKLRSIQCTRLPNSAWETSCLRLWRVQPTQLQSFDIGPWMNSRQLCTLKVSGTVGCGRLRRRTSHSTSCCVASSCNWPRANSGQGERQLTMRNSRLWKMVSTKWGPSHGHWPPPKPLQSTLQAQNRETRGNAQTQKGV